VTGRENYFNRRLKQQAVVKLDNEKQQNFKKGKAMKGDCPSLPSGTIKGVPMQVTL